MEGGKGFKIYEGDWICPDTACANVNFARRSKCNRCGKERVEVAGKKKLGHEIGKALAEKSRGLFSADDWQCSKCGNVNWARRQQCNMCNAPKFGDAEERTGYGGGYNDRGVVEYIRRDDSDSEYDEFGRRKKKKREDGKSSRKSDEENDDDDEDSGPPPVKQVKQEREEDEEEEEDEDEDDDDGDDDLSKYDLSEWGDDNDKDDSTKNSQSQDRSRSPH